MSAYDQLREINPDLFRRAVNIGNIVSCAPHKDCPTDLETRVALAAKVEAAVMDLVLRALAAKETENGS